MAYAAVVFDLLTALLDSWSLWDDVAGSAELGRRWRRRYLDLTYGAGRYRPYRALVREAGHALGLDESLADELFDRWVELEPWPEAPQVVEAAMRRLPVGIATNCSVDLAVGAAARLGVSVPVLVTAEEVGWYKPSPRMYLEVCRRLGTEPHASLFVAGSPGDVGGAAAVGFDVYWHNRIGLPPPSVEPAYAFDSLNPVLDLI